MKTIRVTAAAAIMAAIAPALPHVSGGEALAQEQCGRASWYALTSMTASGERMDPAKLTAAHRNLGFGTKVKVINQNNGRSVVVRINDRGPFIRGRIIDLAFGAARAVGLHRAGVAKVRIDVLK